MEVHPDCIHSAFFKTYFHLSLMWGSAASLLQTASDTLGSMKVSARLSCFPDLCLVLPQDEAEQFTSSLRVCATVQSWMVEVWHPHPSPAELNNLFPHSSSGPQRKRSHAAVALWELTLFRSGCVPCYSVLDYLRRKCCKFLRAQKHRRSYLKK